jgi:hypothetical protein
MSRNVVPVTHEIDVTVQRQGTRLVTVEVGVADPSERERRHVETGDDGEKDGPDRDGALRGA